MEKKGARGWIRILVSTNSCSTPAEVASLFVVMIGQLRQVASPNLTLTVYCLRRQARPFRPHPTANERGIPYKYRPFGLCCNSQTGSSSACK